MAKGKRYERRHQRIDARRQFRLDRRNQRYDHKERMLDRRKLSKETRLELRKQSEVILAQQGIDAKKNKMEGIADIVMASGQVAAPIVGALTGTSMLGSMGGALGGAFSGAPSFNDNSPQEFGGLFKDDNTKMYMIAGGAALLLLFMFKKK